MAFITKDELRTVATLDIVDLLIGLDNTIVDVLIEESASKMKSYLSRYYDVDEIFSKTANERHPHVVKVLKDIVIYEVYERHTRERNLVAERRYNEAMQWLTDLNSGVLGDKTLPPKPPDTDATPGTSGDSRFGGNKRYDSIF